jgi:hypothetical protein
LMYSGDWQVQALQSSSPTAGFTSISGAPLIDLKQQGDLQTYCCGATRTPNCQERPPASSPARDPRQHPVDAERWRV